MLRCFLNNERVNVSNEIPLPVTLNTSKTVTETDASGTIATASTAQDAVAVQTVGYKWILQNLCTEDLYFRNDGIDASAGAGSFKLASGDVAMESENVLAKLSVFSATASAAYTCKILR